MLSGMTPNCMSYSLPCGPVNTAEDLFNDPHLVIRDMLQTVEVPGANADVRLVGNPIKFTKTPLDKLHRAPLLDEHRQQVFAEFGIADKE